uniref:acyl-[acyl-carrier-protein] thioesterase n=1 Tax=Agathobacter sp. TaxID=2021311 RepID=UPI0040569299
MTFTEKFYVGYSDINKDYKLSNVSILKMFEDIACMHSSEVGDGVKDTKDRWFLTGYHIKVLNRPKYEERLTAVTWNREMKSGIASREVEFYNESGELEIIGISNWVRVNGETLRPTRLSKEIAEMYQSEPERKNFESAWVAKLKECDSYMAKKEYFIDRNWIDANDHMNNVYYMDLAALAIPEEVYERGECNEFAITYRKAIAYGETVCCHYGEGAEERTVCIKSKEEEEVHAVVKMWK